MKTSPEARAILLGVFVMVVAVLVFTFAIQPQLEPDDTSSFAEQMAQYQFVIRVIDIANLVFIAIPGFVAGAVLGRHGLLIGAAAGLVAALFSASVLMLFRDAGYSPDEILEYWRHWLPRIPAFVGESAIGGIVGVYLRNRLLPSDHSLQARRP